MKTPVIAIGLDAADPTLIETWMDQGHLKTLRRLRDRGGYARLNTFRHYRAETPWTTFLTGCSPQKTGYWSPVKYCETDYGVADVGAYDFSGYPPFYALGSDYKVAVFDMPQSALSEQANGPQVLAWGAHSALTPRHSLPPSLFGDLVAQYGDHPVFNKDHADTRNLAALTKLKDELIVGVRRRAAICQDLLKRDAWDLFLTVFGETHSAGHFFWHLSQPEHPLYPLMGKDAPDLLRETFVAIDEAIATLIDAAPDNATILVFAAHGMGANVMDLPSMFFLPELLYRFNFGKPGIAPGKLGAPLPPPKTRYKKRGWLGEVWSLKYDPNPIRRFLRQEAPSKLFNQIEKLFGPLPTVDLQSPENLYKEGDQLYFQPARWYKPFWSQMRVFALPSYSEGYIRVNLKGREPQGMVEPAEYDSLCDEVTQLLYSLKDGRTGQPMVREVTRTRQRPEERDPKLPDADLIVLWQEDHATDVVDSPELGRMGPVPYLRTGSHRSRGFLLAQGPGIAPGSSLETGHALDLAPTILARMGAPIPDYFEGRALLEVPVSELVA